MPDPVEIIYTPEIFSFQRVGGISRYFVELATHLQASGQRPHLVAGLHRNLYLRPLGPITTGVSLPFGIGPLHGLRVRLNDALCQRLIAGRPHAVVHQTYHGEAIYRRTHRLVITVHDLIRELFGDVFPELKNETVARQQQADFARADHFIAISHTTKADLVRIFGIDPAKVTVIYHGSKLSVPDSDAERPRAIGSDDGDYLLHVGTRSGYKNFLALLAAFGRSSFLRRRFRLLCVGGGPFDEVERRRIAALGLENHVLQHFVDDAALLRYYRGAKAFVCPSLYEGFGLPIVEAMSQGCPVLCSRTGSLPEIAGAAAAYFDPANSESIQEVLETTLADDPGLASLRTLGRERALQFTWERCAQETLEVYRRLGA